MEIKILDPIEDEDLLYDIVKIEDDVFKGASIGNYNIKPMAKYGKVYAIIENKQIISVIEVMSSFNREIAYIYGLFTHPEYRNMGMAHKLLDFTLKDLKKDKIKRVQLTTGKNNNKACKLYEDFNFKIIENLKDEYKDGEERYLYEVNI